MEKINDNINTAEYWNKVYSSEKDWRAYTRTFEMICNEVGSNQKVIEFGCGTGRLAEKLAKEGNSVLGIDISKTACIKFNERTEGLDAIAYDANLLLMPKVNFHSGSVAVATEFLEHFKDEELEILMPKIVHAADKAIFCVPNDCLGSDDCKEHYQNFTRSDFKSFLLKYYYKVSVIEFIEQFRESETFIQLPTLFALCIGRREN